MALRSQALVVAEVAPLGGSFASFDPAEPRLQVRIAVPASVATGSLLPKLAVWCMVLAWSRDCFAKLYFIAKTYRLSLLD